ncbi:hypothetical protein R1flu_006087 [Riccia fluitans]|uniref:Uncharacterized protein n=1 Tax=Riccia fluitans TaxID=41844 RepID=A0ABD1YV23_9MARC
MFVEGGQGSEESKSSYGNQISNSLAPGWTTLVTVKLPETSGSFVHIKGAKSQNMITMFLRCRKGVASISSLTRESHKAWKHSESREHRKGGLVHESNLEANLSS